MREVILKALEANAGLPLPTVAAAVEAAVIEWEGRAKVSFSGSATVKSGASI